MQTIRACLRHAGGLRIDHVMGSVPAVLDPRRQRRRATAPTCRVHASDLLAIVALESQRARAVIVGEDLGTVEESAREQLAAHDILSYRLLWFEKTRPAQYPENALAAITTHDLPTVVGLVVRLRPGRAEGARPVAERSGHARNPPARAADDARRGVGASGRGGRQGARSARPRALAHSHRDAGRRDGGGGAAEHAGDQRRVAELAPRAARADRDVEDQPAGQADRGGRCGASSCDRLYPCSPASCLPLLFRQVRPR